jgi:hypothetical protein
MTRKVGNGMSGLIAGRARRRGLGATVVAVFVAVMVVAAPAFAKEPTGDFAVFKQCPRFTAGVFVCMHAETLSGSVTIGKTKVPINEEKKSPIVLQGGIAFNELGEESFVGALNGETLSKTPQNVPGGLSGLVNCTLIKGEGLLKPLAELARAACKLAFENNTTGVAAVTELAGAVGINTRHLEEGEGTALALPVKVKLENTFLGSECYIGSNAHPIALNLTDGVTSPDAPNKPIEGHAGHVTFKDSSEFIELTENTLVNNEFAAPEATGCGGIFSALIDPIVDSKLGLPSADGHNTAIENNTIKEGVAEAVIHSEK